MRRVFIFCVVLIITQLACKQEYNPTLDTHMSAIVVEGLITNLKEQYKVKITPAAAYDTVLANQGIIGLEVSILDNLGNSYKMHENIFTRLYYSDTAEFVAQIGRSYILQIKMPDGDTYQSTEQLLTPAPVIDSVYGNSTNKEYLYTDDLGVLTTRQVFGSETFADVSYSSDSIMQFRFDNTIMKCFSYWYWYTPEMRAARVRFPPVNPCMDTACPYVLYNWNKFDINTSLNLSAKTHSLSSKNVKNNSVCFYPFENTFYPILIKKDSCGFTWEETWACCTIKGPSTIEGTFIYTRVYGMNEAASVFYNQVNDQLSSQGKLFDPIAVQIQGNMRCVNNPAKLALGLFEVSSCTKKSYWMVYNYVDGTTSYRPIDDISGIPYSGGSKEEPAFWTKVFH